ncbi:hypothetical protein C8J57DRAFT_1709266 [Mycena rebaudengoi]|nr:hypothetical protein C8J57DRAFT_1709266 [Mycena rebaudengoi]
MSPRRHSVDSSSSSSDSDSSKSSHKGKDKKDSKKKDKKDKKDKKGDKKGDSSKKDSKKEDKGKQDNQHNLSYGYEKGSQGHSAPPGPPHGYAAPPAPPQGFGAPSHAYGAPPAPPQGFGAPSHAYGAPPTPQGFGTPSHDYSAPPPGYQQAALPPSGYRIALNSQVAITKFDLERAGRAPFADLDGSPVYVGSAIFTKEDGVTPKSIHPCKIGPHLYPSPVSVPYGGGETSHHGRYDMLILDELTMEWVTTSHGNIPPGRTPVEGGYEENIHDKLYHGAAYHHGIRIPGKTGKHLGGCHVSFGGGEHTIRENYEILCFKLPHKY